MAKSMLLQRLLSRAQGWVTVVDFGPADAPLVQTAAAMLAKVCPVAWWRICAAGDQPTVLAVFDGARWQSVGEAMPAADDLPWTEHGLHLATDWLDRQREVDEAILAHNPNRRGEHAS